MSQSRFRVVSSHPKVSAAELAMQLATEAPGLTQYLRKKYPDLKNLSVEAEREKGVPIDPATAYLILKLVGAVVGTKVLENLVDDAYQYLKTRIKSGAISPADKKPGT